MPSPLDIPHIKGETLDGEETEAKTSDDAPFAALAFKIATDPFVGKLCFFRVYSGTLESGSTVLNSSKDKKRKSRKNSSNACKSQRRYRKSICW